MTDKNNGNQFKRPSEKGIEKRSGKNIGEKYSVNKDSARISENKVVDDKNKKEK